MTDTRHPECEHLGEYLRMGDHPDMTGRFAPDDICADRLYCLRCEQEVPDLAATLGLSPQDGDAGITGDVAKGHP